MTICNVSSRGLMAKCSQPPAKGSFVEVRRGASCVVGHVRWSQGVRFGLRSQDRIDVAALCSDQPAPPGVRRNDRRVAARTVSPAPLPKPTPAQNEERGRRIARLIDWGALAIAGIGAASLLAGVVGSTLSAPMRQVRVAMQVRPH